MYFYLVNYMYKNDVCLRHPEMYINIYICIYKGGQRTIKMERRSLSRYMSTKINRAALRILRNESQVFSRSFLENILKAQ